MHSLLCHLLTSKFATLLSVTFAKRNAQINIQIALFKPTILCSSLSFWQSISHIPPHDICINNWSPSERNVVGRWVTHTLFKFCFIDSPKILAGYFYTNLNDITIQNRSQKIRLHLSGCNLDVPCARSTSQPWRLRDRVVTITIDNGLIRDTPRNLLANRFMGCNNAPLELNTSWDWLQRPVGHIGIVQLGPLNLIVHSWFTRGQARSTSQVGEGVCHCWSQCCHDELNDIMCI